MHRRDFIKHLALLAAGAAALPEQIHAFERYYSINSYGEKGLIAVDEIMLSGMASTALPASFDLVLTDESKLIFGCNLFGGMVRWVAAPDQKIVGPANEFSWRIAHWTAGDTPYSDEWLKEQFRGHISYLDQDGIRKTRPLDACRSTLG